MGTQVSSARQEAETLAKNVPAERYDRVVRLAQAIFGAPIAVLNLIGTDAQITVAAVGVPRGQRPIEKGVCHITVQQDDIFEVRDLREDERFASLPEVVGRPRVRFYAGVPVRGQNGENVGALCLLDLVPRTLGPQQRELLADLGALVERELAVQQEMDLVGQVQQLLLPASNPDIAGVEIAGRVQPAREAGGDYFDWVVVGDSDGSGERLQVAVGDVMGKGLAASLIASEVRAVLRGHSTYTTVSDAVARTAITTRPDLEANDRFSTLWVGRLDPATGALEYVDAGHGLAVVISERGFRRLYQRYLPLGTSFEDSWRTTSDVLAEDELLVIVSDGVFDVFDDSFDAAEAKLHEFVNADLTCQEIVDRIVQYAVLHDASDDITALAVRRVAGATSTSQTIASCMTAP